MFKKMFIFMLLFLALASLTTLYHFFFNQFITEHRNTFSLTINIKGQCFGEFYPHNRMANIYGQIIVGHCLSDIYWQVIAAHPSQCIHLHRCFTLPLNTDKMEERSKSLSTSSIYSGLRSYTCHLKQVIS